MAMLKFCINGLKKIVTPIRRTWKFRKTEIRTPNISLYCEAGEGVRMHKTCEFWGGVIGRYTYIGAYSSIASAKIGSFCSIGRCVSIGGWMHPYRMLSTNPRVYREILNVNYDDTNHNVIIGNDVWIGDLAIILKGKIGDGAIIGAGAVVTGDIPPFAIAAGNPARVIKYRFDQDTIDKVKEMQWWNWTEEEIREKKDLFLL